MAPPLVVSWYFWVGTFLLFIVYCFGVVELGGGGGDMEGRRAAVRGCIISVVKCLRGDDDDARWWV